MILSLRGVPMPIGGNEAISVDRRYYVYIMTNRADGVFQDKGWLETQEDRAHTRNDQRMD